MTTDMKRIPKVRLIAIVLTAIVATTAAATGMSNQDAESGGGLFVAEFTDASPLITGNEVKVHGVKVGEVADIAVRDGKANVMLDLDPAALPLHQDAKATIRPVSLLGERYVDLDRGAASAPELPAGGVIPEQRTGRNTDLDEVLNTVDDPTGESMAALVTMLGDGMRGNGRNARDAIKALAPAMRDTNDLMKVLREQNSLLNNVIGNVEPVAKALARDQGRTMDGLVDSAHQLLGTTGAQQRAFESMLAQLPSTLTEARSTLEQLTGTARSTTPALRGMRPTTDNLQEISGELKRFADSADPALATAEPVLRKAQRLMDQARPVAAELRKAGPDLASAAGSAQPLMSELTKNISNVLDYIKFWALTTNGHDGVSHYFRAMMVVTPQSLTSPVPGVRGDLGAGKLIPGGDGKPDKSQQQPQQGPPLGLLNGKPQPDGGVTGLSPKQESGALDFLLGGQ